MSERDLNQVKSDKVVDCRGSACPGPLMEAKKGIGAVPVGGTLEIWSIHLSNNINGLFLKKYLFSLFFHSLLTSD